MSTIFFHQLQKIHCQLLPPIVAKIIHNVSNHCTITCCHLVVQKLIIIPRNLSGELLWKYMCSIKMAEIDNEALYSSDSDDETIEITNEHNQVIGDLLGKLPALQK